MKKLFERFWLKIEYRFNRHLTKYRPNWLYNWVGLIARHQATVLACQRVAIKDPVKLQKINIKCDKAIQRERKNWEKWKINK